MLSLLEGHGCDGFADAVAAPRESDGGILAMFLAGCS
jgi:hypothetical protein